MLFSVLEFLHNYYGLIITIFYFILLGIFVLFIKKAEKFINDKNKEIQTLKIDKEDYEDTKTNKNILLYKNYKYEEELLKLKDELKRLQTLTTSDINKIAIEKAQELILEKEKDYEYKLKELNRYYKLEKDKLIQSYELKISEEKNAQNKIKLENIKKGKNYEYQIKIYYENIGYKVFPNGFVNGKNDKGIDLIAYKNSEIRLIQCKCYTNPPKQYLLRKFIGDCEVFIRNNPSLCDNKIIYKDFITSCNDKDYGVVCYLREYPNEINYQIINYIN